VQSWKDLKKVHKCVMGTIINCNQNCLYCRNVRFCCKIHLNIIYWVLTFEYCLDFHIFIKLVIGIILVFKTTCVAEVSVRTC